jgi:O-glycosyl hydrolase
MLPFQEANPMRFVFAATALLLAATASAQPTPAPISVHWVATTESARWQERPVAPEAGAGEVDLQLLPTRLQTVDGFGGCFNEYGWHALSYLAEAERAAVLKQLFDPQGAANVSDPRLQLADPDVAIADRVAVVL